MEAAELAGAVQVGTETEQFTVLSAGILPLNHVI
jgi:hypothetical protein